MSIRVQDALHDYGLWRLTRGAASPDTVRGETPGLRAFAAIIDNPRMDEITPETIGIWWDSLALCDSTKATRLSQLRSFFTWAGAMGYIDNDPTKLIRAPRVTPEPRDRLTPDELLSLLDVARTPRDRCLLALAMNLGLRGGEIARIKWADVHWASGFIRVYVDKTNEVDDMPISSDLRDELAAWLLARSPLAEPGDYVICSQHVGAQGITYRPTQPIAEPYKPVQYALSQIGWLDITQEGVHTIRRSIARIYFDMIEETESFDSALLATMTLLHHTRPDTTLTYIGRDRATLARDRMMRGKPFLSAMRSRPDLSVVAS